LYFKVTIPYREPTYELHTGRPRSLPYYARYNVTADSEEEAILKALSLLEKGWIQSGVGWVRAPERQAIQVEQV